MFQSVVEQWDRTRKTIYRECEMGKNEDEQALSAAAAAAASSSLEIGGGNGGCACGRCRSIPRMVNLRCVLVLVVGVAVFLSAAFWLPPFFRGKGDSDRDPEFGGAYVVASFRVQKPVSLLQENVEKLRDDIYNEIGVPNSSVQIISLKPLPAAVNWTSVVFAIWPYPESMTISSAALSILRENFMSFVTGQSTLPLTPSLFGSSYFFQILKFPGAITIIPPQNVFLLQKVNVLFNFSLNFPIYKVQDKLDELKVQMKSGLFLNSYENLYVRLTNVNGSTMDPPTVVQTAIVLAVGNRQPSIPRLRQLAQTIRSSSHGNLGLNHMVFGRVKQVQLSSFLKHSLNSGGKGNAVSILPSPSPQPYFNHHYHQHHHHHHHHRHHSHTDLSPAPSPQHAYKSPSTSVSHSMSPDTPNNNAHTAPVVAPNKPNNHAHIAPTVALPVNSHQNSPVPSPEENLPALPPDTESPLLYPVENAPAPALHAFRAPLPHVVLTHERPRNKSAADVKHHNGTPPVSTSQSSSCVSRKTLIICWVLLAIMSLLAHL